MEIQDQTSIFPATQNEFIQGNVFKNVPVRHIANVMNTSSAFTRSYTEKNNLVAKKNNLRQFKGVRSGQLIGDFDAVINCC